MVRNLEILFIYVCLETPNTQKRFMFFFPKFGDSVFSEMLIFFQEKASRREKKKMKENQLIFFSHFRIYDNLISPKTNNQSNCRILKLSDLIG